jgi:hypothetical protein
MSEETLNYETMSLRAKEKHSFEEQREAGDHALSRTLPCFIIPEHLGATHYQYFHNSKNSLYLLSKL